MLPSLNPAQPHLATTFVCPVRRTLCALSRHQPTLVLCLNLNPTPCLSAQAARQRMGLPAAAPAEAVSEGERAVYQVRGERAVYQVRRERAVY